MPPVPPALRGALALALALALLLLAPAAGRTSRTAVRSSSAWLVASGIRGARVAYDRETGSVGYLTTVRGRPIARPADVAADAAPATAARAFLGDHGRIFGVANEARDLRPERTTTERSGRSFVRFQQLHDDVPVLGSELVVQLDKARNTVATTGEVLPDFHLDVTPSVSAQEARQSAIEFVKKSYDGRPKGVQASAPELAIYDSRLLGGPGLGRPTLVWRTSVTSQRPGPIDELVLVDATSGTIALNFDQFETARNRLTYTAGNSTSLPGTLRCSETSTFPDCAGGDADVASAHRIAGQVYDFYFGRHGLDSYDNAGAPLVTSVHYGSGFDNAGWDPTRNQMVIGDARTYAQADDVIAHEFTHAVTQRESDLYYYYQAGAINESLSDIFGEFIDLTNGTGNDSPSVRWLMGEDALPNGAVRSLKDPPQFGQPDRMTSPSYWTSEDDSGGVHENSGVGNKAAYLMVDGDSFNGKTVTGIGLDKAEAIYYQAASKLLTSASDYQDLYNALQQACANLIGTQGITAADCQQVKNALDAVEMNTPPPNAAPVEAPVCDTGTPHDLFADDLELPSSDNWTTGAIVGQTRWFYPQNPNVLNLDMTYATSGVTNFWGFDTNNRVDTFIAQTKNVTLPAGASYMRFNHAYHFDHGLTQFYDGGVVEYSTNNGTTWKDAGPLFTDGGYVGTLTTQFGNPLGGRQAFSGQSQGYGSSRLDLTSLAGQNVRFRFRLGTDSTVGQEGWFIDDIRIYTCSSGVPGAPIDVQATPGDREATVTFTAPASSGGSAIITYTVRSDPGGITATSTGSLVVPVAGLTNGTSYTFTVTATNASGEGPPSSPSAAVTPVGAGRDLPAPPAAQPRPAVPDPPSPVPRVPPPAR